VSGHGIVSSRHKPSEHGPSLVNVRPKGRRDMEGVRCVMIDNKCVIVRFINQCSSGVYLSLQGSDAARLKFCCCHKIVLIGEFFFLSDGVQDCQREAISQRTSEAT